MICELFLKQVSSHRNVKDLQVDGGMVGFSFDHAALVSQQRNDAGAYYQSVIRQLPTRCIYLPCSVEALAVLPIQQMQSSASGIDYYLYHLGELERLPQMTVTEWTVWSG